MTDSKNVGLFHYFFFAVAASILVYAGEETSRYPNIMAMYLFKHTAIIAASSIVLMGLSFIPGYINERYDILSKGSNDITEQWLLFNKEPLQNVSVEYVQLIRNESVKQGKYETFQKQYYILTHIFNVGAWTLLLVSAITFAMGVNLL